MMRVLVAAAAEHVLNMFGRSDVVDSACEVESILLSVACPTGGDCPPGCDRTKGGCVQTWGPDADHAEALQRNKLLDRMTREASREGLYDIVNGFVPTRSGVNVVESVAKVLFLEVTRPLDQTRPDDSSAHVDRERFWHNADPDTRAPWLGFAVALCQHFDITPK